MFMSLLYVNPYAYINTIYHVSVMDVEGSLKGLAQKSVALRVTNMCECP